MLAGYGAFAALAFGVAMNLSFWPFALGSGTGISFEPGAPLGTNLGRLLAFTAATSLGWDVGRALTTAVGLALVGGAGAGAAASDRDQGCVRPPVVTTTRRDEATRRPHDATADARHLSRTALTCAFSEPGPTRAKVG